MQVFIGADHRGLDLKEKLKDWLKEHGYAVEDLGAHAPDPADDYPDYAAAVAARVAEAPKERRGILLCGSGIGMDIAANKLAGVRASVAWNADAAKAGRNDDDINIIAIPADWTPPALAAEIIKTFLETPFSGEERHVRRIQKITELETKHG